MSEEEKKAEKLAIRYKTSPNYQTYTADGSFGALTPEGRLAMDFYVEKLDTPEFTIHKIEDGKVSNEPMEKRGFEGLTREKQFGLILNINRVHELRDWLNQKLKEADKRGLIEIKKTTDE